MKNDISRFFVSKPPQRKSTKRARLTCPSCTGSQKRLNVELINHGEEQHGEKVVCIMGTRGSCIENAICIDEEDDTNQASCEFEALRKDGNQGSGEEGTKEDADGILTPSSQQHATGIETRAAEQINCPLNQEDAAPCVVSAKNVDEHKLEDTLNEKVPVEEEQNDNETLDLATLSERSCEEGVFKAELPSAVNPFASFAFAESSNPKPPNPSCCITPSPKTKTKTKSTISKPPLLLPNDTKINKKNSHKSTQTSSFPSSTDLQKCITKWHPFADPKAPIETRRFQVLIAARLHARAQEKVVFQAMHRLRHFIATSFTKQQQQQRQATETNASTTWLYPCSCLCPASLEKATPEELALKCLSFVHYANTKARHLVQAAKDVKTMFGGVVPEDVAGLQKITGIGPKLAGILCRVNTKASYERTEEKQEEEEEKKDRDWKILMEQDEADL